MEEHCNRLLIAIPKSRYKEFSERFNFSEYCCSDKHYQRLFLGGLSVIAKI